MTVSVASGQLRAFIERIERLEDEKKTIADDIKDVYGEAKGMGFDTKILKRVVALRKKDEQERTEEEMILDTYLAALGMIPQFDLFDDTSHGPITGAVFDSAASPKLIKTIVDGVQTEIGRKALITALDIMIENEDEISGGCEPTVVKPMAALGSEESAAPNSPETANETPKQVYGDSVDSATAPPSQSVDIPAGGDQDHEIDGLSGRCPAETNSPETATRRVDDLGSVQDARKMSSDGQPAEGLSNSDSRTPGDEKAGVTVVGTESGTVANSENEAVAPVATALPSAERISPHRSGSAAANTGGDHVIDTASPDPHRAGALVKQSAPAINERCQNVGKCPFSHHPNKITCSPCQKAWDSRKVAVPA